MIAVAVDLEGEEEMEEEAEEESMVCICRRIEDVYHDELAGVVACFPPVVLTQVWWSYIKKRKRGKGRGNRIIYSSC